MKIIPFNKLRLSETFQIQAAHEDSYFLDLNRIIRALRALYKRVRKYFSRLKNKRQGFYSHLAFQIPEHWLENEEIEILFNVKSKSSDIVLNPHLGTEIKRVKKGNALIQYSVNDLEFGENMLAYTGSIIPIHAGTEDHQNNQESLEQIPTSIFVSNKSDVDAASNYLVNSLIKLPKTSRFRDSCYAIYDYDNRCFRMPSWLWSNAPIVFALLKLSDLSHDESTRDQLTQLARRIGDCFINNQVDDDSGDLNGALLSRCRYYPKSDLPVHTLYGVNDTSFAVRWALIPLYKNTGDEKYLRASKKAMSWVESAINKHSFVPSHFYKEKNRWEDKAFVDTGFTPEGFEALSGVTNDQKKYEKTGTNFMDRFISQFRLSSGFYGDLFRPGEKISSRIFTRGQAWVLEGLIASYKLSKKGPYLEAANHLADLVIENQNPNGSWAYLLGFEFPDNQTKQDTGECEKATTVLAYMLVEMYKITGIQRYLISARKALEWSRGMMETNVNKLGFGGIASRSLASGITGLPFLKVATGYANAYYILASIEIASLESK
jgi:hypothetical protein